MTDTQTFRPTLPVVACSLSHADLSQRHERWIQLGEQALVDASATASGMQLVFSAAPGVGQELDELATLERDCCGFATWSVHGRGEELVLDVSAESAEGVAAVQAMFRRLHA